jgi:hypothetical protein
MSVCSLSCLCAASHIAFFVRPSTYSIVNICCGKNSSHHMLCDYVCMFFGIIVCQATCMYMYMYMYIREECLSSLTMHIATYQVSSYRMMGVPILLHHAAVFPNNWISSLTAQLSTSCFISAFIFSLSPPPPPPI